jgi:lactate dehydrogenase-like 2-hydroxyacid dehydrogenase
MKSLDVVMPAKGMDLIEDEIGARLPLHRLWLEPNPDLWLAEWGPRIRALAMTGAHAPLDEAYMRRYPNLEIISSFGVGYDNIDAKAAARLGIIVTNTPGVLDDEVADTALGLMIMTVRQLPQSERYLRAGQWTAKGAFPLSPSLRGRTVGILGLGRIGKTIATRIAAFGLPIAYHGRRAQAGVAYRYYSSLIDMAKAVDILIVVAPGGPGTRHIINAEVLEALGPDGVLINVARGSLVDEKALIGALRNKTILAAGLDVFENEPSVPQELVALDNAVLLPHVGSASIKTRRAMAECVASNVLAWADGKPPLTPVPETPWSGQWGKGG